MLSSDSPFPQNMRDHSKNPPFQNQEVAAAEEALSLCNLPVDDHNNENYDKKNIDNDPKYLSSHTPPSRSEPPDIFEFFSDFSSDMCPADDIFFCGKLVPFEEKSPPTDHDQISKTSTTDEDQTRKTHFRRRCESLSKLQSPVTRINTSSTNTTQLMRNSRSLDYRKLHRSSISMISAAPEIEQNPSVRSVGKYGVALKKTAKPRWYLLMFGMVKFPPEMELSDIKNRQVRRNPASTLFPPPLDVNRSLPVSGSSSTKRCWRLLRALSCKDYASVTVTASFCFPDHE